MKKIKYKNETQRIKGLIVDLIIRHPFFGVFLANTNIIENNIYPTAATNGKDIFYNANFFSKLKDKEVKAMLLHELYHMIYFHCDKKRKGTRNTGKWNRAADYCINWEIDAMDRQEISLPKDIIINDKTYNLLLDYRYKNMYVEEVYELLPDSKDDNNFDTHIPMKNDNGLQREIEDRIISSYESTKNDVGKVPSGIKRVVEYIKSSKIPWQRIFQQFISNVFHKNDDYSYSQYNRRFLGQELYMPSLNDYKINKVLFAPDTSGSISKADLEMFLSELKKIIPHVAQMIVASWDVAVNSWDKVKNIDDIKKSYSFAGGGGTDIKCLFDKIKEKREHFDLVIILTDGDYGKLPPRHTINYPVIFCMTNDIKSEWGMCINLRK